MKIAIVLEALTGSFITDMDRAGREAKKQAEKMRREWEAAGKAVGVAVAGSTAALALLTKQAINTADQMAKMAQKVGVSVEALSTLKYAADQSGVSVETLQSSLVRLTKNASDAAKGTGDAIQGFNALGISVAAADGKLKSSDALLVEIAEKFASFEDGANKTALAVNLFGKSGAELIPMLNAGASGIDELRQRARDLGLELDTNTAKQAEQFNDLLADAANLAKGFGNDLAKSLLPALVSLAEVFVDNGIEGRKAYGAVEMVSGAIKTTAGVAIAGVAQVQKFGAILGMVAAQVDVFFTTIGKNFDAFRQYQRDLFDIGPIDAFVKFTETGFGNVSAALDQASGKMDALKDSFSDIDDDATRKIAALNATLSSTGSAAEDAAAGTAPLLKDVKSIAAEADRIANQNAKSQAAFNFELDRWAAELLPEAERAAAQYNIRVNELMAAQKAGKITADQLARALGIIGTEYQRNAQQIARNQDVLGRIKQSYAEQAGTIGLTRRELAGYMASLEAARDAQAAFGDELENMAGYLEEVQQAARDGAIELYDMQEGAHELERILSNFENFGMSGLVRDIERVKQALIEAQAATGDAFDPKLVAALKHELGSLQQAALEYATGALGEGITSLKSMASEGSKAYKALEVAQTALNLATAIGAIANQGMGDPYTAFARIAAMAAMMSQLVDGIGSLTGGSGVSANSAAYRQERQGTGTVLGDATAKSESILNAVEITANATEQLVGINRGMLNALQAMQAGITGASTLLARGAGDIGPVSLGTGASIPSIGGSGSHSLFVRSFANIFGGKESLRDQGIRIVGGTLSSMIDDILVQSYASIHRSGGWFSSSRDYDRFESLGDDVANQFSMVLGSMADAVRAAAEALGLNMDEINARIAAFQIEEIRISTMDLSAEEAQKELEAAFSAIFDGLAGHVVPFIEQFQQVGEGLAETLIRVATGVQVTQEAMIQLGFALDETDPERFAQVSEALMDLVGGVDAFIDGMSSFVSNFASEEHKFAVAQDALTRAFAQLGIEIPASRDAMWDLMQAQDAATESGREVIAMLLRLAGVSDSYYDMLEDRAAAMERIGADIAAGAWEQYLEGLEEGQRAIVELTRHYDDWIASATEAGATAEQLVAIEEQRAIAMGRLLEAAEADYQRMLRELSDEIDAAAMTEYTAAMRDINRWTAQTTRELNAAARAAGRQAAAEGDLARVHQVAALRAAQALARLQEQAQALAEELYGTPLSRLEDRIAALQETESAAVSAIGGLSDAFGDAARNAAEAMGLLLGSYSPLRASDKLPIALGALSRGETDANTVLQIAREVYASGEAYNAVFRQVQAIVASQTSGGDSSGYGGRTTVSAEMQALIAERDALLAEQQAAQRFMQASNLAQMVADLSGARGEGFDVIAESLGFTLEQFAEDLRFEGLDDLTEYLTALQAEQLGFAELFDTPTAGDLEIVDAIDGLRDAIHVPGPDDSVAQERAETLTTLRDVRDALRVIAERGVNANEDAATATERVAEGVERLAVILESDGPADAANRRRGG